MRILLVTYEYPPDRGGIASYLGGLFGSMPDVSLMKLQMPRHPLAWLKDVPALYKAARQADLIAVSHLLPLGTMAWLIGKPYFVMIHGLDMRLARRKRMIASRVLRKARLVVANSLATAAELSSFGLAPESALVVTPALDETWLAEAVHAVQLDSMGKTVLAAGRFVPRKGFDRLIRWLPLLRDRCGDVRLVLAGAGSEEARLRQAAAELGMSSRVRFLISPDQPALAAAYAACDVFALPARASEDDMEGFGIVLLEAAAFGKPSVASRTGGIPEAVEDGVTGLLADPEDDQDFLEKLVRLLNDRTEAARLGHAGRERVMSAFRWKSRADRLLERLI